jgi:hypothetical protein
VLFMDSASLSMCSHWAKGAIVIVTIAFIHQDWEDA